MTPDYDRLIDAETWAFIRATEAAYPPDAATLSIADQRAVYDRMCTVFSRGYPAGVTAQDDRLGGVPVRRYAGPGPTVLYFHGGGFVVGGLHSHDDVCAEIRAATGLCVVSVDYRLCPEHPHPAAYQDALAAFNATEGPVVLAGDSAGGTLAASVAQARRGDPRLLGQVLIYPGLGGDRTAGSAVTHAHAPMLTAEDLAFYAAIRHPGGVEPAPDPTFAPLSDPDLAGLPPTVIITAECDPLSDDGRAYRDRILAAGGRATWTEEAGLVHGYLRARHSVARARTSFDRITGAIAALAARQWPTEEPAP